MSTSVTRRFGPPRCEARQRGPARPRSPGRVPSRRHAAQPRRWDSRSQRRSPQPQVTCQAWRWRSPGCGHAWRRTRHRCTTPGLHPVVSPRRCATPPGDPLGSSPSHTPRCVPRSWPAPSARSGQPTHHPLADPPSVPPRALTRSICPAKSQDTAELGARRTRQDPQSSCSLPSSVPSARGIPHESARLAGAP